jgi:oligosaccharide repeat unit polymerase
VWWCGWLIVANVSPTGIYEPSGYTQFLYLLMLGSMTVGALYSRPFTAKNPELENWYVLHKWRWIVLLIIPVSIVVGLLFHKAYTSYLTDLSEITRSAIFGSESELFPSLHFYLLYTSITRPVLLSGSIAGITFFILYKKYKILVISILIFAADSIMMLGRKDMYSIVILFGFSLFVVTSKNKKGYIRKARKYGLIIALLLVSIVFTVTAWRLGGGLEISRVVNRYVVQYHTGGFTIFDQELHDQDSRLNRHLTFGRASLGTIEKGSVVLFFRKIDAGVRSVVNDNGSYLLEYRDIGPGITMNAFGTIMYSMYMDGREVAIVLFSALFGYFLMGHYLAWRKQRRAHSLMMCVLFGYVGFMGLFNSPLSGPHFWGSLLLFAVVNRLRLKIPTLHGKIY